MLILKIYDPKNKKDWAIYESTDKEKMYITASENEMNVHYSLENAIYTIIDKIKN